MYIIPYYSATVTNVTLLRDDGSLWLGSSTVLFLQ